MNRSEWIIAALLAVALASAFVGLGQHAFFQPDEYYYIQAPREMAAAGDYWTPRFNWELRFRKPILFYWLVTAAYAVFGPSAFAARSWSAVAAIGVAAWTFDLARRWWTRRHGCVAVAVLVGNLMFLICSRYAMTDMTLTFFITASQWSFWRFYESRRPGWLYVMYTAAGLAAMTKGLFGCLLPLLGVVLFLLLQRQSDLLSKLRWGWGAVILLVIILPWSVIMLARHGQEFAPFFFLVGQDRAGDFALFGQFKEVLSSWASLLGSFMLWLPVFVVAMWEMARRCWKDWRGAGGDAAEHFAFLWFALPLVAFSIARGKHFHYLLPGLPGAALVMAHGFEGVWKRRHVITAQLGIVVFAVTTVAVLIVLRPILKMGGSPAVGIMGLVSASGAVTLAVGWARRNVLTVAASAGVGACLFFSLLAGKAIPSLDTNPYEQLAAFICADDPAGSRRIVAVAGISWKRILLAANRPVLLVEHPGEIAVFRNAYFVLKELQYEALPSSMKSRMPVVAEVDRPMANLRAVLQFLRGQNKPGNKLLVLRRLDSDVP
jgi:4-amino-4-deoxy-L-arabinose transferase-like glycosyltransferase